MGKSAEEVRRDIERTRAQMGYTLDEIGDRVSPRRMVERRTDRVRGAFRGMRESVMGTADYGMYRAASAGSSGMSGISSVGEGAAQAASSAVDTITSAPEMARRQTTGSPLAAGVIAFGAGALIAALLPKTSTEEQMASKIAPALEPVKEQAMHAGQEVANELKASASDAADHVKQHATAATEQVKEQAAQAAHHVSDEATAATTEVKDTASTATSEVAQEASSAADDVRRDASAP